MIYLIYIKFIARVSDWDRIIVKYKIISGWKSDTTKAQKYEDLPPKCRAYIDFIEEFVGVPIEFIGVGVSREQLIVR